MTTHPFSFWLTPAQPYQTRLTAVIRQLARQYDAIPFEPHVTLFVGEHTADENPRQLGDQIAANLPTQQLTVQKLDYTDALFKTLFIAFNDSPELETAVRQIKANLQHPGQYKLAPHLSLLYKEMPASAKQQIIATLDFDTAVIPFDQIQLVTPNPDTQDWSDIAGWRIESTYTLK